MNKRYLPMYSDTNQTNCWLIILLFSSLLTGQARLQAQSPCLTYTAPGLYSFTVPAGGPFLLKLQARGADGGDAGGTGASVESTFSLQTGDQLTLIVGQVGQSASGYGGGGGGTAVILTRNATPTLLVAAGAGAGGNTHGDILGGGGQGLGSSSGGAGGNVGTLGGEIYPGGGGGGGLASAGSQGTNGNNTIGGGGGGQASLSALSPGGTSRYASGGYGFGGGGGTGDNINGSGGGGGGYGGGRGGDARFASSRTDPTGGYSYISATGSATAITVGLGGATQHRDGLVSIQFPTSSVSATITSQTALCANPSATITGTINATGTWTIILSDGTKATGTGSSFSIQVSPTSPTTYTLQCVFDANGVAQPANIASSPTVTVVPLPTAFAVTGGGTYCAGGSGATLGLSNSQTGVSYQLYRDGNAVANTVAGTGSGIRFESQITAGTYTVQATNTTVGSCQQTMTGSATVRFNPSPTATLVSSGSLTCSTRSVTLMAGGGTSYVFSSGATPTGPTTATVANEGPYSVTVTDANGCTATQTTTVQSNITTPSVSLTNSGPLTCTNKTVTLTAGGADTYVFSAGATSTGPNTATLSQAGTYTVTGTSAANGCSSFTTTTVQSNTVAPQDVTLNSSGTLTCATTSVNLTAGSTTQGVSYSISGPGVTGQNGSTATANQQGLYNVKVTGTNGCTATQTTTVSSNTLAPTATLGSSGTITCTNRTVILTAGGGGTYAFSSGASQVNGANTASVTTGGLYSVTVTNTTNGCSSFTTTTVEGNTTGPNASLFNSGPIADKNPTVTLTAGGGTTYAFSQGATPSGNGTATVTTPGIYSVTATSSDNGCTGVASTTVTGAQNPATICRNGTAVIKVIASGNPVKYEWYKNTLSSPRLAEITLQQRGTATSSLTLINQQTTANFYVRVTDANGSAVVYGPFKVTVNMGCVTSLGRLAAEEVELKITLLGNPLISEQLRATVSGAAGRALNIQLLDLSGKSIRQQQWLQAESEQRVEWNLGGQASGAYLLQAVTEPDGNAPAQRHSVKVIKP